MKITMNKITRNLKNWLINGRGMKFLLNLINFPLIGNVYDSIYFKRIEKRVKNSPISLTIEPNNICNLKCVMCPYKRMKRKKETMPLNLFKKIVDEAKELGCKDVHMTQYNEPFTDCFLFDRIEYLRKAGMSSWFYSNGMLLDSGMRKNVLENPPNLIRFSIDGVKKETFEKIRVGADYNKVVNNVFSLYKERNEKNKKLPRIEVYFTLFDKNKDEVNDFLKFWKGKCDFASVYPADSRESEKFVRVNYKKCRPYPCFNPRRILILSNGLVVLCCVDFEGEVVLGDLTKQTLKQVVNSKKFKEVFASQMDRSCKIPLCTKCSKLYIDSAFSWWAEK